MLKSNKFWIIVIAVIVIAAALPLYFIGDEAGGTAYIYSNGELIESIDLSAVTGSRTISAKADGRSEGVNIIEVEHGRIRMLEADCAGGDCVRQGWASNSLIPIVCLPNNVLIRIDGIQNPDDLDGIVS